jgi:hypothetical protein
MDPLILNLGSRGWSASRPGRFIPEKQPSDYHFNERLGGPQSWSGRSEEKNWTKIPRSRVSISVTTLTEISRLFKPYDHYEVTSNLKCLLQVFSEFDVHRSVHRNTGCFKKSFTTLKAYRNLYRGHTQRFELSKYSKTHRVLPRIVIRNCFDLFFSIPSSRYLHRHPPPTWETGVEVLAHFSKVTYNFESVQRTYTTFWTVKM